jgi:hypothetical protein
MKEINKEIMTPETESKPTSIIVIGVVSFLILIGIIVSEYIHNH